MAWLQSSGPSCITDVEASGVEVEGPTIVQDGSWEEEEMTMAEDTKDYVNAAPWTLQMIKLASENARWVKSSGKCEVPLRLCVTVNSEDLGPSAKYWPRCALLHRCSDVTGCCNSPEMTCAAAESENVQLYFYVFVSRAGVQMMTFANNTRCSCQPRSITTNLPASGCKCPRHYTAELRNGQCMCECGKGKSKCRRLYKGRRYFSSSDISCVSRGECSTPTCEFGPFLLKLKRCTKRRERESYTIARK
ncbi:putative PDGF/VEGF domain-containing protein 5 [Homarus americanus]|uniref:Putative PDGF/VEGF domain-containing protein 5 n=1 Tax=Homarus americanus TaxID=6706 RepID=A0A8J5N9U0_HOMAM|nr:putative PDGF/VEGF domain-containing protein 5 [Homarus americanus]